MNGSAAQVLAVHGVEWLIAVLIVIALLSLVWRRLWPHRLVWAVFVLSVSAAVTVFGLRSGRVSASTLSVIGLTSAALSLLWSAGAAVVLWAERPGRGLPVARSSFISVAHIAALLFGVVPAISQSVILVMGMVYVGIDLLYTSPTQSEVSYGVGSGGLWTLGILFASCSVAAVSTRDRRLPSCGLWIAVMIVIWTSLRLPVFPPPATGGPRRSGSTVALAASLAVLAVLAAGLSGWIEKRRRRRIPLPESADPVLPKEAWPGLAHSCGVIAVAVILLVCYHLVVPVAIFPGGFRVTVLVAAGSAGLAAWANLLIISRAWSGGLADAAMALVSLTLCGLAVLLVPSHPALLAERYPMIFSAMIIGFAVATAMWTWVSLVWQQQLDSGRPVVMAGRLIPHAKRSAFSSAVLALLVAVLMAVWPRLRGISTTDDEFGQVTAGLAANLFLLLVVLWSARRLRRPTFHILTVLAVLSTLGFILVRMLPFSPRFG